MSRIRELMSSAGDKSVDGADSVIRQAVPDIRQTLVDDMWFGKRGASSPNISVESPDTPAPVDAPSISIEDQPQVATDDGVYAEVWGDAPDVDELYGGMSMCDELPECPPVSEAYEQDHGDIEPDM